MQTPTGRVEIEKRFPKFTFQYTQSLPKIASNDFEFSKFDFKTEFENTSTDKKTNLLFEAGYALGDVPLTHLYNTSPNNITKDNIIQRITFHQKIVLKRCFFNEFFLANLFLFNSNMVLDAFKSSKVRPSFVLVLQNGLGKFAKTRTAC
jgi:hypothetical protein